MGFKERLKIVIGDESVRSFAQKSDIAEGTLRAYLVGTSEPTMKNLISISSVGNVYIDWLATEEGPMRKHNGVTEKPNGYQITTDAESLPDSAVYCYIPLYDVFASAGHGSLIDNEQVIDKLPFKQEWLRGEMGLKPDDCCLINVTGDSMEPLLHKKDVVMLDRSQTHVIEDGIYCLRLDGSLLIKRIQRVMGQKLKVISDNSAYEAFELDNVDTEDQQIIGRVVWVGKSL